MNNELKCEHCSDNLYVMGIDEYLEYQQKRGLITIRNKHDKMIAMMANVMLPLPLYCKKCDVLYSYYNTMGKALFHLQPLPDGALSPYCANKKKGNKNDSKRNNCKALVKHRV